MKSNFLFILVLLLAFSACQAPIDFPKEDIILDADGCLALSKIPDQLEVNEKFGLSTTLQVSRGKTTYATISRTIFAMNTTFEMETSDYTVVTAKKAFFSWGTKYTVTNCKGNTIAIIKENVFKSFIGGGYTNSYEILDPSEKVLATSEKFEYGSTSFLLKTLDDQPIAEIHRPFINIVTDGWTIHVYKQNVVDSRVLPFIAAFKTYADKKEAEEKEEKEKEKEEEKEKE